MKRGQKRYESEAEKSLRMKYEEGAETVTQTITVTNPVTGEPHTQEVEVLKLPSNDERIGGDLITEATLQGSKKGPKAK